MPHTATELEFAAKQVNDLLAKNFPDSDMNFLSFVMDDNSLGYLSSTRRIDGLRLIMEWLSHQIQSIDQELFIEMLEELKREKWDD